MTTDQAQEIASKVESNEIDLDSFLDDLIYKTDAPQSYLTIFEKYLWDDRPDIKQKCIEAILFALQIQDDKYKNIVIEYLQAPTTYENEDLKSFCAVSLGAAYKGTKDKVCVQILYQILFNNNEVERIRLSCLHGIMVVYFSYTSYDILKREQSISLSLNEILPKYQSELNEIREFL